MGRGSIGVLALQGDFDAHQRMLDRLDVPNMQVRTADQMADVDGLIIPGGESTTLIKLIKDFRMEDSLREFHRRGQAIFGTCAGSILAARTIENSDQFRFGFIDITVRRNGYGRQVDSFERDINVPVLGEEPLHAVFIRAPKILRAGREVTVLARLDDSVVAARQGRVLVSTFHPELTEDERMHRYFVEQVVGS
jgi:5'-phosphate synthase pdxT subunit